MLSGGLLLEAAKPLDDSKLGRPAGAEGNAALVEGVDTAELLLDLPGLSPEPNSVVAAGGTGELVGYSAVRKLGIGGRDCDSA